ncbi:polyketide antibiotic transporter [Amycolatopsis sp. YIM 10]|uniref:polyketide antibiotic transporter n=1 Tax=Amycolatopsis sp. YIM 10 TaxID=2653857 RepID=UPI00128FDDC9|nr:polyketide antibiotic transporter [Amycolatopsis sp. YIM 10]QFU91835.1 ABC-2 family transporter protein [Amycolatopsis sp. YIM 10]
MIALTLRQLRFGALTVIALAAGMSALVAGQYQTTFAGALDGGALQALAANPAIRTLFGPPLALDDPGGFTVWRTGTPIAVLVGVWAILTTTRLTRGDEDAGRWDLLLSGLITARGLLVRRLAVLAVVLLAAGAAVTAALIGTGTDPAGAVLHGAGVTAIGWVFAAVGGLGAQLLPARAPATGAAVAVLGAALLARMVSDGLDAATWVHWLSPFGLFAQLQPYAGNHPGPLLVLIPLAFLLAILAVALAGRRDLHSAPLTFDAHRRARTRLLRSVSGFALRRALRPWTGWVLGIGAYYLLIGLLTLSISRFMTDNRRFSELAAGAGFGGLGSPEGFAAAMFSLLAIPAGMYAAVRLGSFAEDESSRRAVLLFGLPLSRGRLLGAELVVVAGGTVVLSCAGGLAMWAGATAAGAALGLPGALAGALNIVPIALLSLGAAVLGLGWLPKATVALGAVPAVGGFFYQVIAQNAGATGWLLELSPFAHLAAVPDTAPDWAGTTGLLVLAIACTALGALGYTRRDLAV